MGSRFVHVEFSPGIPFFFGGIFQNDLSGEGVWGMFVSLCGITSSGTYDLCHSGCHTNTHTHADRQLLTGYC